PPPDHVARSAFFRAVLLYEGGKFGEALARFTAFPQQYPNSPFLTEAQLRQGFCHVQVKEFPQAIKVLQPLVDKEPRHADQTLLWRGKAQAGAGDLKTAQDTFRRAAEKAQQLTATDPEAKLRRGEILFELADAQQLARQHKEAAATYAQIFNEKMLPQRAEEA